MVEFYQLIFEGIKQLDAKQKCKKIIHVSSQYVNSEAYLGPWQMFMWK